MGGERVTRKSSDDTPPGIHSREDPSTALVKKVSACWVVAVEPSLSVTVKGTTTLPDLNRSDFTILKFPKPPKVDHSYGKNREHADMTTKQIHERTIIY